MPAPPIRGILFAALAFTLGILIAPFGPGSGLRLILAFVLLAVLITFRSRFTPTLHSILLLVLFLALGWARGTPLPDERLPKETAYIEGRVRFPVEERVESTRYRLGDLSWRIGQTTGQLRQGAIFYVEEGEYRPGERLRIVGQIAEIPGVRNPGGFDAASYWGLRGIGYRIAKIEKIEILDSASGWYHVAALYGRIRDGIDGILEWDSLPGTLPLAQALILGDRGTWDESLRDRLARSGLMHIFAISGLHIGVLLLLFRQLFGMTPLGVRRGEGAALLLVWLLLPLTGLNPPAVRAAVMLTVYVLGRLFQRVNRPAYSLLLAYLLLLFLEPSSLRDAGFQLSFAGAAGALFAVGAFDRVEAVATSRKIAGRAHWFGIQLARFYFALLISLGAWTATAPIVIYHFGRFSWFAAFVSVPAIGLLYLILAAGWLAVFTSPVGWLSSLFGASLHTMLLGLDWLATLSDLSLPVTERLPVQAALTALFAAVLLALLARKIANAPVAGWLFAFLTVGCLVVYTPLLLPANRPMLLAVDVGQGDGFLLRCGQRVVLIDGGDSKQDAVDRLLRSSGLTTIDLLILTHGDADHAGAVAELVEHVKVRAALIGPSTLRDRAGRAAVEALQRQQTPVFFGQEGTQIELGALGTLTVIGPDSLFLTQSRLSDNDLSLVTVWELAGSRAIFTGDATDRTERSILAAGRVEDVDLLVAGHHGSRYSTSETWLRALAPETVVVSCGRDNRYGHPAPEVLERLSQIGVEPLRTDLRGAYLLEVKEGSFNLLPWSFWW